jgi:uridine phosphorylase
VKKKGERRLTKERAPILEFPGEGRAILEPFRLGAKDKPLPNRCVLCFFTEILKRERRRGRLTLARKLRGECEPIPVYRLGKGRQALTVSWPGMTAPFAAAVLEELIALGCNGFIACGGAGVLDGSIPPGKLVIPTQALRDEGTSYHYSRASRYNRPHPQAVKAIREACRARGIEPLSGRTWTTDGVFRETPRQIRNRREEGCLTVEMEAAAFFAVARYRKVRFGQVLYAGDDVSGTEWNPRGWRQRTDTRQQLFDLAVEAARRLP